MDNTVQDLCSIIGGGKNLFFDRMLGDYIKAAAPELIHPCPYTGIYGFTNFSMSILSSATPNFLMPSMYKYLINRAKKTDLKLQGGDYRSEFFIYDDIDPKMFSFVLFQTHNNDLEL